MAAWSIAHSLMGVVACYDNFHFKERGAHCWEKHTLYFSGTVLYVPMILGFTFIEKV